KNLAVPGEEVRRGRRPLEADLAMGIKAVTGALGWTSYRPSSPRPGVRRGIGMACSITNAGANPTSTAIVRLLADGSAIVLVGTTELGQGSRTTMAQIAAEELGMSFDAVRVISSDTGIVPYDRSTGSSRSTTLVGLAVQGAAIEVRDQLLELATKHFESAPGGLTVADGAVAHGDERIAFADLVGQRFDGDGGELIGRGYVSSQHESGKLKQEPVFWEVGIGAAEVEVEEATGQVRILRYVSAIDCGKAINPQQAEGQDEGAAMQAIGHTMFEEMVYEDGQLLNPNLIDYRVPTFADLPEVFETILIENGDGPGPYGAKGIGEGGVVAVAPAVANAIYNATGVRIKDLPLTPERVWRALEAAKRESS
ncbi:MAG: molybdopterin-dependent oxidoreductase, partial [Chloroflexi bacterium]|nr:molybdopterin-dependent oxidoreductase [Chloroflexota bacterium]